MSHAKLENPGVSPVLAQQAGQNRREHRASVDHSQLLGAVLADLVGFTDGVGAHVPYVTLG
jgi:hypothetical protein